MKKTIMVIFCTLLLGTIQATDTTLSAKEWIAINQKILELQDTAKNEFTNGQYAQAVTMYEQILTYNPDDVQAQTNRDMSKRAVALTKKITNTYTQNQYALVITAVDNLAELNSADTAYAVYKERAAAILDQYTLAKKLFTESSYTEAVDHYAEILKINPEDSQAQNELDAVRRIIEKRETAMQSFMHGDYAEAQNSYKDILVQNPIDSSASKNILLCGHIQELITRADNSIDRSDFSTAFTYLQKVTELNPHDTTIQKRTIDYKKIIDYADINKPLLAASLYAETLYNYDLMLGILVHNERLTKERTRIAQALSEKQIGYSLFSSENYTEALNAFKKVYAINPTDTLASRNISVIAYTLQLKNKALESYKKGQYARSLEIYTKLTSAKLTTENNNLSEWIVYRGQLNQLVLPLINDTIVASKPLLNWQQTATDWTAELNIPLTTLVGYYAVVLQLQTPSGEKQTLVVPYRVEDKAPIMAAGYVEQEKDVQL